MAVNPVTNQPDLMLEHLRRNFRYAGLPVSVLEIDYDYDKRPNIEPDVTVEIMTLHSGSTMAANGYHKKDFTSPLFRWEFEDGRRFQARPKCYVKTEKHFTRVYDWESAEFDRDKMLQNLTDLIKESYNANS